MKKLKTKLSNMHTLDKYLIASFTIAILTLIYSLIIFAVKGEEPTSILDFVKWLCGLEGGLAMVIKVSKIKSNKTEDNNDGIQDVEQDV